MSRNVTVAEALARAADAFAPVSDSARLDAELLLGEVLKRDRTWLFTWPEHLLTDRESACFDRLAARRAAGEPVAYILGRREFWSLDLAVTPATLIPRPDTELLVEQALARLPQGATGWVADLGAGSGAVALALAKERPGCRVLAVDTSPEALAVARANAVRNGIANVEFLHGSWFEPLAAFAPLCGSRLRMVVSNPPYVPEDDPHLGLGDVRFEPRTALAAGFDGLDAIRAIIAAAPGLLDAGGWLLFEHGYDQGAAVRALLAVGGFSEPFTARDLGGRDRVSGARTSR